MTSAEEKAREYAESLHKLKEDYDGEGFLPSEQTACANHFLAGYTEASRDKIEEVCAWLRDLEPTAGISASLIRERFGGGKP